MSTGSRSRGTWASARSGFRTDAAGSDSETRRVKAPSAASQVVRPDSLVTNHLRNHVRTRGVYESAPSYTVISGARSLHVSLAQLRSDTVRKHPCTCAVRLPEPLFGSDRKS